MIGGRGSSGLNLVRQLAWNEGRVYARRVAARRDPAIRAHWPQREWTTPLSARVRKLIGLVAILAFLAGYIVVMASLGERVPDHWAAKLAFYVVAGVCWGVPILPLISWMNRGRP